MADPPDPDTDHAAIDHERLAKQTFNATWDLLDLPERTPDQDDDMLERAYASAHHWRQVGTPLNAARAQWLLARVHAAVGNASLTARHANTCLAVCEANHIGDFDLAFAHEAVARAAAVGGRSADARSALAAARATLAGIADADDRAAVAADLDDVDALLGDG